MSSAKSSEIFDKLYSSLNPAQKQAVDAVEGPVMVIAGPGTGKTSILTLRIANILRLTDTAPENILALTFTESGAYNMRRKLVSIIGTAGYKVGISTFHGFAQKIINEHPERFPRIIGSKAGTDLDFYHLIEVALGEGVLDDGTHEPLAVGKSLDKLLTKDPTYYVKHILREIRNLKREGYTPKDLLESLKKEEKELLSVDDLYHEKGRYKGKKKEKYVKAEERLAKNRELAQVFAAYEALLEKNKLYDFEDMIIELVRALRSDSDLLLMLQENYQYILADEHQDANNSQNAILELLSSFHPSPNLFIVGDEKQAIYRFQGASLQNFLYFKDKYPEALLINLEHNYRSRQQILDATHSLIEKNQLPNSLSRTKLRAGADFKVKLKGKTIQVNEYGVYDQECQGIANIAKSLITNGTSPEEIAILYRNNYDAFDIAEALSRAQIPYNIESQSNILEHKDCVAILDILRAIHNPTDDHYIGKILFLPCFKVTVFDAYKLMEIFGKGQRLENIIDVKSPKLYLIDLFTQTDKLVGVSKDGIEALQGLSKFIEVHSSKSHEDNCLAIFKEVLNNSGLLHLILSSPDSLSRFSAIEALFHHIREQTSNRHEYMLSDFIHYLDLVDTHEISVDIEAPQVGPAVRLMTAHSAKGLEFDHVIIAHGNDGKWGNQRQTNKFHIPLIHGDDSSSDVRIQDERRLFYVAMTRARQDIVITYSLIGKDGREQIASQFIGEIDPGLCEFKAYPASEYTLADRQKMLLTNGGATTPKSSAGSLTNLTYIRRRFAEQGLSVTSLNNYLECPWKYFFVNLIHIPEVKAVPAMIGTAVHNTLKDFFDKYRVDETMSLENFLKNFERHLSNEAISRDDFTRMIRIWSKDLSKYYSIIANPSNSKNIINEYSISGVHLDFDAKRLEYNSVDMPVQDYVLLKGKLDKIEILPGSDRDVKVIDYKTGAPKTRNEILGKTQNSDGNPHRQLVFYKLLLDLDPAQKFNMVSGELVYLVPDNKDRFKSEVFDITNTEVEDLKQQIIQVTEEILDFKFKDRTCDAENCSYCVLAKSITGTL